ncbi:MAG: alkaline phosphatase [Bacteroidales bacterium]
MKRNLIILFFSIVCGFGLTAQNSQTSKKKVKNIILMIGDGMGTSHVYAALTAKKGNLNMCKTKHIGFSKTYSSNRFITDSGAGGTALATGCKANNRTVGLNGNKEVVPTILELAEKKGMSTGLISTSAITHATPASFIAHNKSRADYEGIALDFLKTDVDIFIGGGYKHFFKRSDGLDLKDSLLNRGYEVITTMEDLNNSSSDKIAALLYPKHGPKYLDGRGEMLVESAQKALEVLKDSDQGFFLMIEGSQIDFAAHSNDTENVVAETVDFDNAVGKVVEWALQDGETLVIVTADHETGGFAVTGGNMELGEVKGDFVSKHHTATMVPVFAFGPKADLFQGVQENTDINKKMKAVLELD